MQKFSSIFGSIENIKKMVDQGNPKAQLDLGHCYHHGIGVREDARKAFEWYEKSALQGNATAQCNLGICYQKGYGTVKDYKMAAEWYAKAAHQDHAMALNNLGFLYEQGRGVNKDYKKAFDLYSKAADLDFVPALANVGHCYEKGLGIFQSYRKADSFYRQAAERGDEYAKNALKRIREKVEEEDLLYHRQKVEDMTYARVIPLGQNYIVKNKGMWGIVNKHNTPLLPIEYEYIHCYNGGYVGIQKNDLWGLANEEGTVSIEPQYETLRYLSKHHACEVGMGDDIFLVDVNNHVILRVSGKTVGFYEDKLMVSSKGEKQLYNLDGTPLSQVHTVITSVGDYFMAFDCDGETLIKKDGREVKLPPFEKGLFVDRITPFRFQDKYGIIDDNADIVVPNQYGFITLGAGVIAINEGHQSKDHDRCFYQIPSDGKWLFWNYDLKEITPYWYDRIDHEYCKGKQMWFAERNGCWYQMTPEGEVLFANSEREYKEKMESIKRV